MAAKSDGVIKMKRSDVAFTPLQNSDHSGSVQGLNPGSQPDSGTGEGDFVNADSRCCGSSSTCLRLGREQQKWTVWDALWILAAVAVYVADVGTDVWLSVDYYLRGEYWWFGLTLFFVALGSLSVQVFSFRWFVQDFSTEESAGAAGCAHLDGKLLSGSASHGDVGAHPSTPQRQASTASKSNTTTNSTSSTNATRTKKRSTSLSFCIWFMQSLIHTLQLGQIWRYFHTLYLGVRSRRSGEQERWRYHWRMVYEYADVSMLHLLATFLESAPQLVLQLCIIIRTHTLQALQGWRLLAYYAAVLLENAALSALWYLHRQPADTEAFAVPALCVIFSSFLTGVLFMLMYYAFFHPNGARFGRSGSLALDDPASGSFTLPPEGATNSLRSNRGGAGAGAGAGAGGGVSERDGFAPVFQVRPTAPSTPSSCRAPRGPGAVLRIDLCRNRYPAWERHLLDRSIRKAVLAAESGATPPRLQYKDDALMQERLEYETTL
ncbi:XK-related protein 4-like isoform X2 [Conger conger]|uniref:XK-related protein 4-like isoform X2 n=1 Tax=Conger conger TaxID=82655 RepID=UPI002A5A7DE6|nr:XK-related protein 4-like isoform X2 [Conger conger]